jgi:iron complex outermembrane recepter protein
MAISGGVNVATVMPAVAQDANANESNGLEEIVVTAQKREQKLEDVGIAITAFSATQLKEMGITDTSQIAQQTPGFHFVNAYGNSSAVGNPVIRGVSQNDFSPSQESPVATYIDNAYMSFTAGNSLGLFDLDRVEVDKGPQGTLFGRNATGGLVQLVTKKPTDTWDGYIDQTFESYNGYKTEGAIGGPVTDDLSFRAAFYRSSHDGYEKNLYPGTQAIGQDDTYSGRLHLQYKSDDGKLKALLTIQGTATLPVVFMDAKGVQVRDNGRGQGVFTGANTFDSEPGNGLATDQEFDSKFRRSILSVTGDVTYDLEVATLEAVTNIARISSAYRFDIAFTAPPFVGGGLVSDLSVSRLHIDAHQLTQELRLSSSDGPVRWTAGLYYLRQSGTYVYDLDLGFQAQGGITAPLLPDALTAVSSTLIDDSYAGFGQLEYDLLPDVTAILGYRFTEDDKTFYIHPGSLITPVLSGLHEDNNGNDSAFKAELDWRVVPGELLYAGVTRGNKAGGFQLPNFLSTYTKQDVKFGGEDLTDYEIGSKTTFLDNRARFNISAYYYDYQNFQSFALIGVSPVVTNRPARFYGGDGDFSVNVGDGINLSLGASFIHTDVYDYSPQFPDVRASIAPVWTVNGSISKDTRVGTGIVTTRLSGVWTDHYYQGLPNSQASLVPSYFLSNARVGYIDDAGWEVAFFVNNLLDKRYQVLSYDASGFGFAEKAYGSPRWFGGELRYNFGGGGGAAAAEAGAAYVPPPAVTPTPPAARSYLVFFNFNKSDLTPQAITIVNQAATNAGPAKVTQLTVTGYTDTVGSDAYNMRLSRRRAESVAAQLEKDGIPSSEIQIVAKGKRDLLVPTSDGVKEPQNRRVRIVYEGGSIS